MTLTLRRLIQNEFATYGVLADDQSRELCKTLELPWRDNQRGVSCIPAGIYTAHRRFSPKHKCEVFQFDGVPGRDDCEIHIANLPQELRGCVATGTAFGQVNGQPGVTGSRIAFDKLMHTLAGLASILIEVLAVPAVPAVPAVSPVPGVVS